MPDERTFNVQPQNQHVITEVIEHEHTFSPESVKRFFISNIISRVWATLYGWTGSRKVRLACSEAGYLKVSSTGTTFSTNVTKAGNAPDTYGTAEDFGVICPRVDIFAFDFACVISRSDDGVTYDADIEIPANYKYSYDGDTRYIKVKNKTALSVCRFQFVGWY